jgi:hypothetical protein
MTQSSLSTDTELLGFLRVGWGEVSHIYTDGNRTSRILWRRHTIHN